MSDGRDLVHLTTCGNPIEAGALREYLADHGVFAYVQGEHHSSMLGQYGSFLIDLRVLVAEDRLDEARELYQAFREADPVDPDELDAEAGVVDLDPNPPRAQLVSGGGKRPAVAAMLAIVPSFGFGHFYSGAYGRGLFLAAVQAIGVALLTSDMVLGVGVIVAAMVIDLGDGMVCAGIQRDQQRALPAARVVDRD